MKEWLLQEFSLSFPSFSLCIPFFFHSTFSPSFIQPVMRGFFPAPVCQWSAPPAGYISALLKVSMFYRFLSHSCRSAHKHSDSQIHECARCPSPADPCESSTGGVFLELTLKFFSSFHPINCCWWIFIDNNLRVEAWKTHRHQCHCCSRESLSLSTQTNSVWLLHKPVYSPERFSANQQLAWECPSSKTKWC